MARHNDFGNQAEKLALDYLKRNGYEILATNWRFGKAEIDIIARKDNTLVFVEVKARSSGYYGQPQSFIDRKKIKRITEAAHEYILQNNADADARFDVIAILKNKHKEELEHIENAFYWF
jgi:putative endonuclease